MTDIIKRVEAAEAEVEENWRQGWGVDRELLAGFVPDLVDELKAARAENERLSGELNELLIRNARRTGSW